ncbi:MAG: metallophosphoesterase, partial [Cyanobacteria bacterium REEB65]|nr:metallophosphoesterase [Cyanobacteria bacterium REEB65]
VGNHEQDNNLDLYLQEVMQQRPVDFSVDFGGWRFVTVDDGTDNLTDSQIQWLDQQLATPSPAIVFCHEPPQIGTWVKGFSSGSQAFMATLAKHPNVKAALFAHIHYYDHMTVGGIPYVVSGGGGAPLNKHIAFNAPDGLRGYNYLICHLGSDGTFSYQMVPFTAIAPDPNRIDTEDDIPAPRS